MITIGIKPGSATHGVAIYSKGELKNLDQWTLPEIISYIMQPCMAGQFMFSIEDARLKRCKSRDSAPKVELGMCQQAQLELERFLDSLAVPYVYQVPQRGNWAKLKDVFETVTGWKGTSNERTRAAAFIGHLGLKQTNRLLAANQ